jgi:hypothetical protein
MPIVATRKTAISDGTNFAVGAELTEAVWT